jgi:hypothetical protein
MTRKSTSSWDVRLIILIEVSEQHTAYIFRVEEYAEQASSKKLSLHFDSEDRGSMFLRNVGKLLPLYKP